MAILKPDENPTHRRVVDYMDKIAAKHGFEYSLEETHANRELLIAVWDVALRMDDEKTGNAVVALQELAYQLAWASRMGEMMGCYHKEPTVEERDEMFRLFNFATPRLDFQDVRWVDIEKKPVRIEYTFETDDATVGKLKPNKQLHLWEKDDV